MIPPAELLSSFMSASMPGVQLSDDGDTAERAHLLNEAARMSIQHVSEHVALEHVDCEEMELTAISFFMHQVRLRMLEGARRFRMHKPLQQPAADGVVEQGMTHDLSRRHWS